MPATKPENERLAVLETQMKSLVEQQGTFVTREAFKPVQMIVYGLAGLILSTVFSALVLMVVTKG